MSDLSLASSRQAPPSRSVAVPTPTTGPGGAAFAWPMPPLASYALPAPQVAPEDCVVIARVGQQMVGRMLSLDAVEGVAQVHVPPEPTPLPLQLDQLRRLTLTRVLSPLAGVGPGASGTAAWPSLAEHPRQTYTVHFVGGEVEQGQTIGHVEHALGWFVFPPAEPAAAGPAAGSVCRALYPRALVERFEIGPPIGQVLVASAAATPEQIDAVVEDQAKLRRRKIGEILVAKRIVTMEQLFAALDKQARLPMVRLGDALVSLGAVTEDELTEALRQQSRDRGLPLGVLLTQRQLVTPEQVCEAMAVKMGYPWVALGHFPPQPGAVQRLPAALARRLQALPLVSQAGRLVVALPDPTLRSAVEEIERAVGAAIAPVLADADALVQAVAQAYPEGAAAETNTVHSTAEAALKAAVSTLRDPLSKLREVRDARDAAKESRDSQFLPSAFAAESSGWGNTPRLSAGRSSSESPVIQALAGLVHEALQRGVSHIHIESQPGDAPLQVRWRRDGRLEPGRALPAAWRQTLLTRLKSLCEMEASSPVLSARQARLPLARLLSALPSVDLTQALAGMPSADLQVTVLPTHEGREDLVLQLPVPLRARGIDQLGLGADDLGRYQPLLARGAGLLLVVGPGRSGRTTTLHGLLSHLNRPERTLYTAEERLEIIQPGLRQVEVCGQGSGGWPTASALRAFRAADADVIMVGELRDRESAQLALEAAGSGKLVLAGMTGRCAAEAVTRLTDLGLDPFHLADNLLGVHAQRLIRRLCSHCRMSRPAKDSEVDEWLDAYLEHAAPEDPATAREALLKDWLARRGRDGKLKRYHSAGCERCGSSGLGKRTAVHELLVVTREMRRLIRASAPSWHLHRQALREGMRTQRQDAIDKLLAGLVPSGQLRGLADLTP